MLDSNGGLRQYVLVFSGKKVREEYSEITPEITSPKVLQGVRLVPVDALIRMKLSSFRLKDQVHLKDLDEAGVITQDVVDGLSAVHRNRLEQVRATA